MSRSPSKDILSPMKSNHSFRTTSITSKQSLPVFKTPDSPAVSPAEALEVEIQSKQRTLALLDKKLPIDAALQDQIMQRDRRIYDLNMQLLQLQAASQAKSKGRLTKLKEQVTNLQSALQTSELGRLQLEETVGTLRKEVADWKSKAEEAQETGSLLSEALTEETEGLKAELEARRSQTGEMKQDIMQLSRIIQEMTKLNTELNAKIDSVNQDTATRNTDYYTAVAKAEQSAQLEKELGDYMVSSQRFERQVGRLTESLEKAVRGKLAIEAASREVQGKLQELGVMFGEFSAASTSTEPSQIADSLKAIRYKLKAVTPEVASKGPPEVNDNELSLQVKDLQATLKEKDRQIGRDQVEIANLMRKLERIQGHRDKEKADCIDAVERSQRKVSVLLEQISTFSDRLDTCRTELGKKEFEVQLTKTQALHLKDRVQEMKRRVQEYKDKHELVEKLMTGQRATILRMQTERFDQAKQMAVKERQMTKTVANVKAMQEELFHKDTEIMRKTKEVAGLMTQLSELEGKLQEVYERSKSASNEGNQDCMRRLEEKTREIEILKEMIRGAQTQVKQKGSLLARYRKSSEERLPSMRVLRSPDYDI